MVFDDDCCFVEILWCVLVGMLCKDIGNGMVDLFEWMVVGDIKVCWIVCMNLVVIVLN